MGVESDGVRLHDKATRGESLAPAERERLDAWYAAQDAEEEVLLTPPATSTAIATLREQITVTAAELQAAAHRVGELTAQNAALQKEIAALQRQLAQRAASRVA